MPMVSTKGQVAPRKAIREQAGIKPGDQVLDSVIGGRIVLTPKPRSWAKALRGLHQDLWEGTDATRYVRSERAAWR